MIPGRRHLLPDGVRQLGQVAHLLQNQHVLADSNDDLAALLL
jgi:hypothetical protein